MKNREIFSSATIEVSLFVFANLHFDFNKNRFIAIGQKKRDW
jgi:hypothetical protein